MHFYRHEKALKTLDRTTYSNDVSLSRLKMALLASYLDAQLPVSFYCTTCLRNKHAVNYYQHLPRSKITLAFLRMASSLILSVYDVVILLGCFQNKWRLTQLSVDMSSPNSRNVENGLFQKNYNPAVVVTCQTMQHSIA